VGEEVADGDRLFTLAAKLRDMLRDAVVEPEQAALPELRHRDRRDGLAGGHPDHQRVRPHRNVRPGQADRPVGDDAAGLRHEKLRSHVEAVLDPALDLC
jgi:hypothetical protein